LAPVTGNRCAGEPPCFSGSQDVGHMASSMLPPKRRFGACPSASQNRRFFACQNLFLPSCFPDSYCLCISGFLAFEFLLPSCSEAKGELGAGYFTKHRLDFDFAQLGIEAKQSQGFVFSLRLAGSLFLLVSTSALAGQDRITVFEQFDAGGVGSLGPSRDQHCVRFMGGGK